MGKDGCDMGIVFHTTPRNQGQIVEVSFALGYDVGVWMRVHDRSDRSTYYRLAKWTPKLYRWAESEGPQNSEPPTRKWGKKMSQAQFERMAYDE